MRTEPPADWLNASDASTADFLQRGGDVNARDEDGGTALMAAAMRGSPALARDLIARGAELDAMDVTGVTALMIAARFGHAIIVEDLLRAGARVNLAKPARFDGSSALHAAVQHDQRDSVEALLDAGADPNARNGAGVTPLMMAEHFGHSRVRFLLLRYGAR
jgi:serine/threonine-protein phosphatase 6 regulatory ankyrin repeat subunit B